MIRLDVSCPDITEILAAGYTVIRIYTDSAEDGAFTTLDGTETLVANTTGYSYADTDGTSATWYKTAYYGATPGESDKSDAQQGGTVDAYCSALDVRKELAAGSGSAAIGQEHEDALWDMCVEASRLIDDEKQLESGSYNATASAARYFYGNGRERLAIDCAVSISEVAVEETDGTYTVWASTDYFTWPYSGNEAIRRLDVNDKSDGSKSVWTRGPKRVKVTAVWGVSATPPSVIVRACKTQVARWYKRAMTGWQDAGGMAEMGTLTYTKSLDPLVQEILRVAPPRRARL